MVQTLISRPYVFAFLAAFLILGRIYWGWRKTFLWLFIGYVVAWASEVSSIHNGFPYGLYHYIYENMKGELMVAGVPFWDSLSYPFMIFAGYTTAEFILAVPPFVKGGLGGIRHALLGAFLTMLLDIIIDPLTVLGDRWFLGHVYYYPNGGQYFGVPLTNFAGWFLVPLVVIVLFQRVIASVAKQSTACNCSWEIASPSAAADGLAMTRMAIFKRFLNPLFYLSIALFNIIITIYIDEPLIASIDCFLLMPVVGLIIWRTKKLRLRP